MKGFNPKATLFAIIFFLSLVFPSAGLPETSKKEVQTLKAESMVIKSNTLEIDNKKQVVEFMGDVDARRGNFIIHCQKMLLHYNNQTTDKDSGKVNIKVDKIIATGKVKIIRTNGGLATAEKAIYYQNEEKVVLTGKPVVKQGNDFVEGSRITLFLKEKRSIVEGSGKKRVKAVLSPRSEKR